MATRAMSRTHSRGSKPQTVWVTSGLSFTVVGGVPNLTQLTPTTALAVTTMKGLKILRVVGRIQAVPTVAPAAGAKDTLVGVLSVHDAGLTAANIDPALAVNFDKVSYMWRDVWGAPFTAAPVSSAITTTSDRLIRLRKRRGGALRVFRDNGQGYFLTLSSAGTQSWSITGDIRTLYQLT